MIVSFRDVLAALVLVAGAALPTSSAFAQDAPEPMNGMSAGTMAASSPAGKANAAAMEKMNQAMGSAPMTGDPDLDFVAMMMPHHQGAIDMAQVELQYGKDPVLRKLATGIVAAQKKEIAEMQAWQAKHTKH